MADDRRKTKVPMREQDPKVRARNFEEVPYGYNPDEAIAEAERCLLCKKPACVAGCPVEIDIPRFIGLIRESRFHEAARAIKEKNALPAICGRVCPQEEQCEVLCVVGKKGDPVCIGNLERFAADYEAAHPDDYQPEVAPANGHKIGIVGSGPAGLTVAADLALKGYKVTIFEALHKAGGVLVYGIPEFRLPKSIVQRECDYLESLGVEIKCNVVVGTSITVDELFQDGYKAVFVGVGAGLPMFLGIPGENLNGVYSANEYLTRANLMKAFKFPEADTPIKRGRLVATFGGGNVAMDSARTALRLGAEKSYVFYRRAMEQMPAREAEIHHADEEGLVWELLTNPIELLGDDDGNLRAVKCVRMELGEPDASGRRRPIPVKGSEFETEIDTAIVSIGNNSNPLLTSTMPELDLNRWGNIVADEATGKTSKRGVFAGGDIVTGAATVILAAGAGRKAADAIHEYIEWTTWGLNGKLPTMDD